MTKIRYKYPKRNPNQSITRKEQYTPKVQSFHRAEKKKDPHQEAPKGNIQENSRGDTSGTHTYSLIKQKQSVVTGTDRASRGGRHRNATGKKKIRDPKHLQGKCSRSCSSAWYQGRELQGDLPKLERERIRVCGGKLEERGRSSAPHQETRRFLSIN